MAYKGNVASETNIGKQLKALVRECMDDYVILDRPKYKYFSDVNDKERDDIAIGLVQLLMETTYFSKATKVYIGNYYISKADTQKELAAMGIEVNVNTVASRIRADFLKFGKDFGGNIVVDLFEDTSASISEYSYKLRELEASKNGEKCKLDEFRQLMIPQGISSTDVITDEQVEEFIKAVEPYTKKYMRKIERSLDKKTCYYVRKLLSRGAVNSEEMRHLDMLNAVINEDIKVV